MPRYSSLPRLIVVAVLLAACTEVPVAATTTSVPETTTSQLAQTTTSAPTTTIAEAGPTEITVTEGQPVGGLIRLQIDLGSVATLVVTSDADEEVHVHGYDLFYEVGPGRPAEISFQADVPGVFEVELEGSHILIAEIEVR